MKVITKENLCNQIKTPRTIVRKAIKDDLPKISSWPLYQWPYESFNIIDRTTPSNNKPLWWQQINEPDRCHYSVIHSQSDNIIGIYAFVDINWAEKNVNNMGVRIAPHMCRQGYCVETLQPLVLNILHNGIKKIKLDVAASNSHAVHCYEKCGMKITGEFWEKHTGLPVEPNNPKWAYAMPHMKFENNTWLTRFYWMEITQE